jgi:putative ABC transport system substrate-binding protein
VRRVPVPLGGLLLAGSLLLGSIADAQETGRVYRVGLLSISSAAATAPARTALLAPLAELGYREGRNLVLEERYADGDTTRLDRLAADLVRFRVEVIVAVTTPAALAAKRVTSTIPIVIATSGDAVGSGLVKSLAHPGGNVTGGQFLGTEMAVKQMELLKEIAPGVKRIGLLGHPAVQPELNFFREMERVAPTLGVSVQFVSARTAADHGAAFATMSQNHLDGLVVAASTFNHDSWQRIVQLAAGQKIPAIYLWREYADAGGLMAYGPSRAALYRHAAVYVDRILKGARPADLPMEQPRKFDLVVNLPAARALGLSVPESLLLRADDVIR